MRSNKKKTGSGDLFDQRTQHVLQGIIDSFINNSEPVGSRTLSKTLGLSISPATIRNIMSDLSDQGYLT
ncbi:MAG: heat-inducible transcription repressor HrcA, partial [SAR324 cluster bacterium]|nr:heat-inducible transcription repressor HrcA [SAR324 cluster bacterium]